MNLRPQVHIVLRIRSQYQASSVHVRKWVNYTAMMSFAGQSLIRLALGIDVFYDKRSICPLQHLFHRFCLPSSVCYRLFDALCAYCLLAARFLCSTYTYRSTCAIFRLLHVPILALTSIHVHL
jgi:hypothetical protein